MIGRREDERAGISFASSGFGVPGGTCFFSSSQSTGRSAVVVYPVASTNSRNSALVTSCSSRKNALTSTGWAGRSLAIDAGSSVPIVNRPPAMSRMPGGGAASGVA